MKSTLNIHWKDCCWSWNSSILVTWCKEMTHWKRPWPWGRLKAKREEGSRRLVRQRRLDSIIGSMGKNLSKFWEIVKDRETWHAAVYGVSKSQTWLSNSTTTLLHSQSTSPTVIGQKRSVLCNKLRPLKWNSVKYQNSLLNDTANPWLQNINRY